MKASRNKWRCADRLVNVVMAVVVVAGMFAVGVVVMNIMGKMSAVPTGPRSPVTIMPG